MAEVSKLQSTPISHADRQTTEVAEGSSETVHYKHKPSRPRYSLFRTLVWLIRVAISHAYFLTIGSKAFVASGNNLGGSNKLKRLRENKTHSPSTPHRPDTSRAKRATEAWISTALRYISVHILYDL
jgi:hypothetical protein